MRDPFRFIIITIVAFSLGLFSTSECPGAVGDIINQFSASGSSWAGGGIAWRDGYIWDHVRGSHYLNKKDPVSGQTLGSVYLSGNYRSVDITWDSTHGTWWITEPFDDHPGDILQYPADGGSVISSFNANNFESGIFYDAALDRLWIGNNVQAKLDRYTVTGQRDYTTGPGIHVQGVCRAGDHLWLGNWTDGGGGGKVYKYTIDGTWTGVSFPMPGGSQANSLDFDGQYLWALGQNSVIYQIDIGFTTPTPAPSPTPLSTEMPIIDSGDYNGDGTSDIAIFRQSTGLWAVRGITQTYFGRNNDIPVPGDYTGDGITDIGIYRAGSRLWAVKDITRAYFGGGSGLTPVPGDYNGDGLCDIALFKESSGLWAIRGQTRVYFGAKGDLPVPNYFTGSRRKDIAVFRPSTGLWSIKNVTRTFFGQEGDIPIAADYNNDRQADISIYRPSTRLWAVKGQTRVYYGGATWNQPQPGDYNGSGWCNFGFFQDNPGLWKVRGVTRVYYGKSGDIPVSAPIPVSANWNPPAIDSGDYNGDGTSEIAIFRDSTGLWAIHGVTQTFFGERGDIPVSGDYNGDGTTDIGIYRPSSRLWAVQGFTRFYFGNSSSYLPIPGDYNGDGRCDYGIFNTNTGLWQIRVQLWALFISEFYFGTKGDIPVPGHYSNKAAKRAAYFRPSTGQWAIRGWSRFYFGQPQDTPIIGDYNGDGFTDIGIYRQSERLWAIRNITQAYFGGYTGNQPVPADYRGNGTAELGIFQENTGTWAIRRLTRAYFGTIGDTPVVR